MQYVSQDVRQHFQMYSVRKNLDTELGIFFHKEIRNVYSASEEWFVIYGRGLPSVKDCLEFSLQVGMLIPIPFGAIRVDPNTNLIVTEDVDRAKATFQLRG